MPWIADLFTVVHDSLGTCPRCKHEIGGVSYFTEDGPPKEGRIGRCPCGQRFVVVAEGLKPLEEEV